MNFNDPVNTIAVVGSGGKAMTEDIAVADSSGRAMTEDIVVADSSGRAMTEEVATPTRSRLLHSGIDWRIAMSGQSVIEIDATLVANSGIADVAVGGNMPSH